MITLKNICKDYKVGKESYKVLKDISLSFASKGFVSILGPSGCGKTTLLNLIGGLDKPSEGQMFYNQIDTNKFSSSDWDSYRNNCIGFVFQNFNLIHNLTVFSNIELSIRLSGVKRKIRKEKVKEALRKVGLEKYAKKKPHQLSGGEQQRVTIARAIVNNPNVILADEPTGQLDSVNNLEVMKILKDLSKDHLVILVTHNEENATVYSDRIINLFDGRVKKDEIIKKDEEETEKKKLSKVHMSLFMSFSLGIKNIYSKLLRTLLTILAASIGIVAVALVISVSDGVQIYINDVQSRALEEYPIIISSKSVTKTSGTVLSINDKYPTTDKILVTKQITNYQKYSNLDSNFVSHITNIEESKYSVLNFNRSITLRLMSKDDDTATLISTSYLEEMINDEDFMLSQYDVIGGTLPTNYNEIALVVDEYNSIGENILDYLELNKEKEEYAFSDFLDVRYKLITNNEYYYYDEDNQRFRSHSSSKNNELYDNAKIEIKIVGIIRPKEDCEFSLYTQGLLYTAKLTDFVYENSKSSDIVKEQEKYGLDKDVTTNQPFVENEGSTYSYSKEYQYESKLITYGAIARVTRVEIYSQSFENRLYIQDYIKKYEKDNELTNISYSDRMTTLTKELTSFIEVLSKVLLILAMISLVVSCLMIAIITYISVIERTKEIGILRSVGARKIDIGQIFCVETFLVGITAGLIGILFAFIFRKPINLFVHQVIKDSLSFTVSQKEVNLIVFDYKLILLMVFGSACLTLLSGVVPAIIASLKKPIKALKSE